MFIYIATNTTNGKRYIGQTTKPVVERWRAHLKAARCKSFEATAFSRAIRKYGANAFVVESIQLSTGYDQEQLDYVEKRLIAVLRTRVPFGYNLREGGNGGALHETTRAAMKAGWHQTHHGRPHSDETRRRMSEARRGKSSAAFRAGGVKANAARTFSAETRAKISQAKTGQMCTPEVRAKMSASLKGRPIPNELQAKLNAIRSSEEYQRRMSETMKRVRAARCWSTRRSMT